MNRRSSFVVFGLWGTALSFTIGSDQLPEATSEKPIQVIAHRGASADFPENTRSSTLAAVASGDRHRSSISPRGGPTIA